MTNGCRCITINRKEYDPRSIVDQGGKVRDEILRRFYEEPCQCAAVKTALILQGTPSPDILRHIDDTPFGLKIIAEKARCLGFTASTPPQCARQTSTTKARGQRNNVAYEDYLKKAEIRANTSIHVGGPIHQRVTDWQLFTFSKLYYVASQHEPTPEVLDRLQKAQTLTVGTKQLTPASCTQAVLRAIGIKPLANIELKLRCAMITAAIRRFGRTALTAHTGHDIGDRAREAWDSLPLSCISPSKRADIIDLATRVDTNKLCDEIKTACRLLDDSISRDKASKYLSTFLAKHTSRRGVAAEVFC